MKTVPAAEPTAPSSPGLTPTEEIIKAVWEELLKKPVELDQGFFELGGDSLLVSQCAARLSVALNRVVSGLALLQHPTVRRLASYLSDANATGLEDRSQQDPARSQRQRLAAERMRRAIRSE